MANESGLKLDNWSKGLLISIISKAISGDRDLNQDDIEKLKEIKKLLQEIQAPDKKSTDKD
ncbi:MAG: hypothetical protein CVV49_01400 [Spirochaetae bacterium HGW-Spirochaetae-5]|nr:MAG: hypothetical protein CVV49_01400 [Spirochaetae bacterium HGW-Spirochaetae-5]